MTRERMMKILAEELLRSGAPNAGDPSFTTALLRTLQRVAEECES
jgi:hypothetical protein